MKTSWKRVASNVQSQMETSEKVRGYFDMFSGVCHDLLNGMILQSLQAYNIDVEPSEEDIQTSATPGSLEYHLNCTVKSSKLKRFVNLPVVKSGGEPRIAVNANLASESLWIFTSASIYELYRAMHG